MYKLGINCQEDLRNFHGKTLMVLLVFAFYLSGAFSFLHKVTFIQKIWVCSASYFAQQPFLLFHLNISFVIMRILLD